MPSTPPRIEEATQPDGSGAVDEERGDGPIRAGTRLGRYVILRALGTGGAGTVYEAFDPELGRGVAIKVLHFERHERESTLAAHTRLLREAQAMAKVRHPNVMPVYDVGTYLTRVFVAMELVEGGTLRAWLRQPRRMKDVLRVLMAAGRGLAAAHAAGLVHRDFKPDNVLLGVGTTGEERVLVTDFGLVQSGLEVTGSNGTPNDATHEALARLRSTQPPPPSPEPASEGGAHDVHIPPLSAPSLDAPLTETGALLGTPGYMAPEQILMQPVDARSDQFAFCVTLYDALCEGRPFPGTTVMQRLQATVEGRIHPGKRKPSARLLRALERGLSIEPRERWPSMDALLAELARDPVARARPWLVAGGVAVAAAVIVGGAMRAASARIEPCIASRAHLRGAWDEATKGRIEAAFSASGAPFAADALRAVEARLDSYADRWAEMHQEACLAGVRGEQVPEVQTLRMECLDERLAGLRATTEVLASANRDVVTKSIDVTGGLRRIEPCADVAALRTPVPLPDDPAVRARVQELRGRIEAVRSQLLAGKVAESLTQARALASEARGIAHPPLVADALFLRGLAEQMGGDFKTAETTLEEDATIADAARADHTRAEALVKLAFVVGYGLGRRAEGLRWGRLADAAVARVGDRALEADAAFSQAVTYLEAGDRAKTLEAAERAVRINREVRGPDNLLTVKSINVLGAAHDSARELPAAEEAYRLALATYERVLGPHHPYTAAPLGNLGLLYTRLGRYEEAVAMMRRSNQIESDAYGPDHVDVALGSANIAAALRGMHKYDEAIAEADASIAIYERTFGPDHVDLYLPLLEKGRALLERGDPRAAIASLERSVALGKPGDVDPVVLAEARFALGRALVQTRHDLPRGDRLVKDARAQFASPETPDADRVAAVDAWLAERR